MRDFIYDIPTRVYFGTNQLCHLSAEIKRYGDKVLFVYGGGSVKRTGLYTRVMKELTENAITVFELGGVEPNPRVSSVRNGAEICKKEGVEVVLAVGGGSVMDAAKWIAAAAKADFDAWDFFSKWAPVNDALPVITVPTAAATGSEMDSGGVISNPETRDKLGRTHPMLYPKVAFEDPTLTYTCSAYQTACGSADIMSHIIEEYFNTEEDFDMLESFMEGMMRSVVKYAPIAIKEPENYKARAELMWTSSWAINGFIGAGKEHAWSCHPIEHEVSAIYDITHGLGLAIITPRWMRYCLSEKTISKYVSFAVNVFGVDTSLPQREIAERGISELEKFFFDTLGLDKSFSSIGITDEYFDVMAKKSVRGGVLNAFVKLTAKDVKEIFKACL